MTSIWSDILLGSRPSDLHRVDNPADFYLVTDIDVPFAADSIRYFPDQEMRANMLSRCATELERRALPYALISGGREARLKKAIAAIRERFGGRVGK